MRPIDGNMIFLTFVCELSSSIQVKCLFLGETISLPSLSPEINALLGVGYWKKHFYLPNFCYSSSSPLLCLSLWTIAQQPHVHCMDSRRTFYCQSIEEKRLWVPG